MNIKLLSFTALLLLGACCTAPEIVPDSTGDSVIMLSLKEQIAKNSKIDAGWGWIAWYLPVVGLAGAWAWRELIKKPFVCDTCEFEKSKIVAAAKRADRIAKLEDKKSSDDEKKSSPAAETEASTNSKPNEPTVS
jgi:hypothetical protein